MMRAILSLLATAPIICALAGHDSPRGFTNKPHGGHSEPSRRDTKSLVATISTAIQGIEKCKSSAGVTDAVIADVSVANSFMSCITDVTNIMSADMDVIQPGAESLFVDSDGTKYSSDDAAVKVSDLIQAAEAAFLLTSNVANGETGDMMQTIVVDLALMQEDLSRVSPDLAKHPRVVESYKVIETMNKQIDTVYGPENLDD